MSLTATVCSYLRRKSPRTAPQSRAASYKFERLGQERVTSIAAMGVFAITANRAVKHAIATFGDFSGK